MRLETLDDQAGVEVDVAANGEDRDAAVFDTESGDVWTGLNGRLHLYSGVHVLAADKTEIDWALGMCCACLSIHIAGRVSREVEDTRQFSWHTATHRSGRG